MRVEVFDDTIDAGFVGRDVVDGDFVAFFR